MKQTSRLFDEVEKKICCSQLQCPLVFLLGCAELLKIFRKLLLFYFLIVFDFLSQMLYFNNLMQCVDFRHLYTLMSLPYGNYGDVSGDCLKRERINTFDVFGVFQRRKWVPFLWRRRDRYTKCLVQCKCLFLVFNSFIQDSNLLFVLFYLSKLSIYGYMDYNREAVYKREILAFFKVFFKVFFFSGTEVLHHQQKMD